MLHAVQEVNLKNPKFFTVEEAEKLIGMLDTTFERIKRNKQQFLWLQEEISILKLVVECGADGADVALGKGDLVPIDVSTAEVDTGLVS